MIRWTLWFFAVPFLFLADGLVVRVSPFPLDVAAALCLVFALFARTSALPGLLFGAASARALLFDGDVALHFLGLGLPVAALLPVRALFFERSVRVQAFAGLFLAVMIPRVTALFAELSGQSAEPAVWSLGALAFAALVVPSVAFVLRRSPPLSLFVERGR